jgi:hypothetical protein
LGFWDFSNLSKIQPAIFPPTLMTVISSCIHSLEKLKNPLKAKWYNGFRGMKNSKLSNVRARVWR